MSNLSEQSVRKRFHEASVEREALMEKLDPVHAAHKALVKEIQALEAKAAEIAEQMKPTRARLFDLENEMGKCARFCAAANGKSVMGKREELLTPAEIEAARARGLA